MMKFAQESGKSKGQFYTPSEVSRIIARLIGIGDIKQETGKKWTFHDPAAGFRVIIMTQANSQVNTRVLELLPKFKIKKK